MTRVLVPVVGLATLYAAAAALGARIMPSYLAAWLACLSVPVGALPLVMGLELAGFGGAIHTGYLRWMLPLLPVIALAGLPILVFLPALYPWVAHRPVGLDGVWFNQTGFVVRSAVYLATWSTLGVLAHDPPAGAARSLRCAAGLALHLAVGTLAANDWIMSLAPGLDAAGFGLLVMVGQSALAVAVGLLLVPARPPLGLALLLACMTAWVVLHFTQYLIVWSADRPAEAAWYLRRIGGLGQVTILACVTASVAAFLLTIPWRWKAGRWKAGRWKAGRWKAGRWKAARWTAGRWTAGRPALVVGVGLVVAAQTAASLWLVIPSLRGSFMPRLTDAAALLALAGFSTAVLWPRIPRPLPQ